MRALKRLWREHRLLVTAFALALAVTVFFAARTIGFWIYWSDPARRDMALEGWMTPGYVAASWRVDKGAIGAAVGLEPGAGHGHTLAQIAAGRGETLADLEARVMDAIAAARAGK